MPNGEVKVDPKVAKGALAGAVAGMLGERNFRAEDSFRDALRAARKAGVTDSEIERVVGSAIIKGSVDRWGPRPVAVDEPKEPPGLEGALAKISGAGTAHGRFFLAGLVSSLIKEAAKRTHQRRQATRE